MPAKIDLTGHTYGRLTVIKEVEPYVSPKGHKKPKYLCQCSCGNNIETVASSLRHGVTKSCGCLRKEVTSKRMTTHGLTKSKEHNTWAKIKQRCYNPNSEFYNDYGGRGITVAPQWVNNFEQFLEDVGPAPEGDNVSIDRIDTNGNYEPGNVRWVCSYRIQAITRRKRKDNKSGHTGVHWYAPYSKWQANIGVNNKLINLGYFDTKEEAITARRAAEEQYHKPLLEVV